MPRPSLRPLARVGSLIALTSAACLPFHHGAPASARFTLEPVRTTYDTLHVALTVVNRSDDEVWVRRYDDGPTVEIRDAAGRERCTPPIGPIAHLLGW